MFADSLLGRTRKRTPRTIGRDRPPPNATPKIKNEVFTGTRSNPNIQSLTQLDLAKPLPVEGGTDIPFVCAEILVGDNPLSGAKVG